MKKSFVFLVILLLIFTSFPQLSAISNSKIESSVSYEKSEILDEKNDGKGEWKTNTFCRIRVWVHGVCDAQPVFGIGFIREGHILGELGRCKVIGLNGKDHYIGDGELNLRFEYLFGYTLFKFDGWNSEAYMGGFALKCRYKVE